MLDGLLDTLLNISSFVLDWPCGTKAWDPIVLFPVITRFKAHAKACLSHSVPVRQPSATFLPADTPQESSRVSGHVTLPRDSLLSANTTLDLSLSRIKTKQHSDPDVLPIINRLRTVPSDPQFDLQDDAFSIFFLLVMLLPLLEYLSFLSLLFH